MWAEHQANQGGPKRYQAHPIPVDRIREAVAERWKDSDRGVRVRTLGALRLVNLDNADIGALAALLHHEDPLTRMEAVLLMADQQGAAFLPVATRLAETPTGWYGNSAAGSAIIGGTQAPRRREN